jgi:hypothetical protein
MKKKIDDRAALGLALKHTLAEKDRGRVEQVQSMLADPTRTRRDVLEFCSYHRQMLSLRLRPWESPPIWIDPDNPDPTDPPEAVALCKRMLAAGVSLYHPDPIGACEEAERLNKAS